MVADPLHPMSILLTCKDVKPNLGPVINPLRNLNRFVLLAIRRINTIDHISLSDRSEIRVQFQHRALWSNSLRTIYLNLVVSLRERLNSTKENDECNADKECR